MLIYWELLSWIYRKKWNNWHFYRLPGAIVRKKMKSMRIAHWNFSILVALKQGEVNAFFHAFKKQKKKKKKKFKKKKIFFKKKKKKKKYLLVFWFHDLDFQ